MQERFYVSHNGEEVGPFSMEEIFEKLKTRQLWSVDYVYVEEKADWITLEEFSLQFDKAPAEPAPVEMEPVAATPSLELPVLELPQAALPSLELSKVEFPVVELPALELPKAELPVVEPPMVQKAESPVLELPLPQGLQSTSETPFEVQLVDGVAVVEFTHEKAGVVSLSLMDQGAKSLTLSAQPEIFVKAAHAVQIRVKASDRAVAGETLTIQLEAVDAFGNLDEAFAAEVQLQLSGSAQGGGAVSFKKGKAQSSLTNTKAEAVTLSFSGLPASMPMPKAPPVQFVAGPAVQYMIETPKETVAGERTQVTIRAVDAFGNHATDAKGSVQLVKNSKPLPHAG